MVDNNSGEKFGGATRYVLDEELAYWSGQLEDLPSHCNL